MDERVIDLPLWARSLLVKGIILNTRPKASAKAYKNMVGKWFAFNCAFRSFKDEVQKR